jgi:hypothetical protein
MTSIEKMKRQEGNLIRILVKPCLRRWPAGALLTGDSGGIRRALHVAWPTTVWTCSSVLIMLRLSRCRDGALGGCPTVSVALAPIPTGRQPQNGIPGSGKTPL